MNLKTLAATAPWDWPDSAKDTILGVLKDTGAGPSDRLIAAQLASSNVVVDNEVVDCLLAIVRSKSESDELRARAASSLGPTLEHSDTMTYDDPEYEDPEGELISEAKFCEVQQTLHNLYLDTSVPSEVRRKILEASVHAPQDWHEAAISEIHSSEDPSWRLSAVFCMRFVEGFDQEILAALESGDREIQYEAVCAAGNNGVDEAWFQVSRLARSEKTEPALRLAAIEALGGILPEKSIELLQELQVSDDEDVADTAAEALAFAGGGLGFDDMDVDAEYDEDDDEEDEDGLF